MFPRGVSISREIPHSRSEREITRGTKLITRRGESGSRGRYDVVREMENAEGDLATDRERRNVRKKDKEKGGGRDRAGRTRKGRREMRNDNFAEEPSCARANASRGLI